MRLSFQPARNKGRQAVRGLSGSALLSSPRSVLRSAWDVSYQGCQALSSTLGRVEGAGVGTREGEKLSAQRTAVGARTLPSLTTHIFSKCALDVASSNPNRKPGERMSLWLALFSVPWNICRHGDPSPEFFFFFKPCKIATCLFDQHVHIHVASYFLLRPSFLFFLFFFLIFAICAIFL